MSFQNDPNPTIIILNGASSSGKTSILRSFQEISSEPFLDAGIDKFIWMLPKRYLNPPLWSQVFEYTYTAGQPAAIQSIRSGPLGDQLISGMHQAIAALARAGNHVIADHVLLEPHWWAECATLFAAFNAYIIGVRCPLEVLEQRERDRKDRTLGQARAQFHRVHAFGSYDFEVDSSRLTPAESTAAIQAFVRSAAPCAFKSLKV